MKTDNYVVPSTPEIFDRSTIERPCHGENYVERKYHGLNINCGVVDYAVKDRKVEEDDKQEYK